MYPDVILGALKSTKSLHLMEGYYIEKPVVAKLSGTERLTATVSSEIRKVQRLDHIRSYTVCRNVLRLQMPIPADVLANPTLPRAQIVAVLKKYVSSLLWGN